MSTGAAKPHFEHGFEVTIVTPNGETKRSVDADLLTVGRAEGSNLVIAHETLSRRHLTIHRAGDELFVEDHGSANGSFVNGKRIKRDRRHPIKPGDLITMGEATVSLRASVTSTIPAAPAKRVVHDEGDYEPTMTEIYEPTATAPTGHNPLKVTPPEPVVAILAPKANEENRLAAERALAEAQRQATLIITRAEVEAERRGEAILRRAHEAEAKIEEANQKRLSEAYQLGEQVSQAAQRDSREMIETARAQANQIRTQAEAYGDELRARTKAECERALEDAHRAAREMRDNKMDELVETERARREDAHLKLKAELDALETRARKQIEDEGHRRRTELEQSLLSSRDEHRDLRAEIEALSQMKAADRSELSLIRADLTLDRVEAKDLRERRDHLRGEVDGLATEVRDLGASRGDLDQRVREAQAHLVGLNEALAKANERAADVRAEVEREVSDLKQKLEAERARALADEAALLEQAKLETSRRTRDLELQMMEDLAHKRDQLAREVWLNVDAFLKTSAAGATGLEDEVRAVVDRQIAAIAEDDSIKRAQASLTTLRRRQRFMTGLLGCLLGGGVTFGALNLHAILSGELSPMQRRLAAANDARARDLEERRFNPPQSPGYKATYVDNVVYGLNFTETFIAHDIQNALMKELAPYMLRVWRLDEDKVIEALAIAKALVTGLAEKRRLIHPDTIQKNLEGMKKDEVEALKRMTEVLGSQVRLESYLKFEKSFFDRYRPGG